MLLNLLSIPELNFKSSWVNGWVKIRNLNKFDKYMTLFWFLGPFIYLIERDPADLWLTILGLIFLVRCTKNKDWEWTSQIWFKSALILWLFGLFSAITSPDPLFSFQQGFVWIRFPLYAAAAQVWLAKDRDIRIIMLFSVLIGMLLMCCILISEIIFAPIGLDGELKQRLSWPYGDIVPGGYLAKFSLPLFCVLVAIAVRKTNKVAIISGTIAILSIIFSILTGERGNFIIRMFSGILAGLVWKPKLKNYLILICMKVVALSLIAITKPDLTDRFSKKFLKQIPIVNTTEQNPYWGAWRGGIQQGLLTPLKGIGPSGTRNTCVYLDTNFPKWLPGSNYCGNHPHNFYIQLFAEVGIIGLILGFTMFISITITCFKARMKNLNCPMASTAFIVPFALFFPLQQFGSFYGQWGNLFTWFAIALAISQYQGWRKIKKNPE